MDPKHIHAVEKALQDALKSDKARFKTLKMSEFGIVEMTRQRMRPSVRRSVFMECPHCHGSGQMRTPESIAINILRLLPLALSDDDVRRVEVTVGREVAQHLNNVKRHDLAAIEERFGKSVVVNADPSAVEDLVRFLCQDRYGTARDWTPPSELPASVLKSIEKPVPQALAAYPATDEDEAEEEGEEERAEERAEEPTAAEAQAPAPIEQGTAEGAAVAPEGAPAQQGEGEKKGRRRRRDRRHRGGRGRSRRFRQPGGPEGVPGEGQPGGEPGQGEGQPGGAPSGDSQGSGGGENVPPQREQAEHREPEAPQPEREPGGGGDGGFAEGL